MEIVCLDMEGTLTEEIWQQVAEDTGIEDFAKTTRDIPSYSDLMDARLVVMEQEGITLKDIQRSSSKVNRSFNICCCNSLHNFTCTWRTTAVQKKIIFSSA